VPEAKNGQYYFKSVPLENAHQYRFDSPLARYVVEKALSTDTPTRSLTFSVEKSLRASAAVKTLVGKSGELTVKVITFSMKAKNDKITESYMLAGAVTVDGEWLDHEYVSDILDLSCTVVGDAASIDGKKFKEFWGSASSYQSGKSNRIEGKKTLVEYKEESILDGMKHVEECLQSSISYGGGKDLDAFVTVQWL
jgi:hypothetical protein